jgi:hypothetical protein
VNTTEVDHVASEADANKPASGDGGRADPRAPDIDHILSSVAASLDMINRSAAEIAKTAEKLSQGAPPSNSAHQHNPRASALMRYKPSHGWDYFVQITTSGLFFMVVGIAFLVVAGSTITRTHSALTFVLVVVGVAILLYGTGTQGWESLIPIRWQL